MIYALIPLFVSVGLLLRHLAFTDASRASKLAVATAVVASLVIWRYYPQWLIVATLVQVGVSLYMLVYWRVQGPGASLD